VKQTYKPTLEIRGLLELFRRMVNDCIDHRTLFQHYVAQATVNALLAPTT